MRGAAEVTGTVEGILRTFDTTVAQDDIVRMFHSYMSTGLDKSMYGVARADKKHFGHVYDWDMIGNPNGQLWRHDLDGGLGKRVASYHFVPAVRNVPKMTKKNTGVDEAELNKLRKNGKYKFPMRAIVFESGMTTTIAPAGSKAMFIPLRGKELTPRGTKEQIKSMKRDNERGFMYVKTPVEQRHDDTRGVFTAYYKWWYESQSDRIFAEDVAPRLERPIRKVYLAGMNRVGSSVIKRTAPGMKSFRMSEAASASKAAEVSMTTEMKKLVKKARYISLSD